MKGNRILITAGLLSLTAVACEDPSSSATYSQEQFRKKVDSTVAEKIPQIRKEMKEDYEMRKAIIFKSIQDSLKGTGTEAPTIEIPQDALLKDTTDE